MTRPIMYLPCNTVNGRKQFGFSSYPLTSNPQYGHVSSPCPRVCIQFGHLSYLFCMTFLSFSPISNRSAPLCTPVILHILVNYSKFHRSLQVFCHKCFTPVRFMCSDLNQIFLECIHNLGVLIFGDPFKISSIINMHMSVCKQHRFILIQNLIERLKSCMRQIGTII